MDEFVIGGQSLDRNSRPVTKFTSLDTVQYYKYI